MTTSVSSPALQRLIDQVRTAAAEQRALNIVGGNTKAFLGGQACGEPLFMRELSGISSYEPTELVVTARAGTPLAELNAVLARAGQYLPFDPPQFAPGGTVGGMVAAGLSGPARAAVGSVRDYVLGVTMLDGRGQVLTFGGQVMKNVAGYDVSRVLAGSMGVLGVILEVSLKVLPQPVATQTLAFNLDRGPALALMDEWRSQPLPVNATVWNAGVLSVRLSGARAAVEAASAMMRDRLGARVLEADAVGGQHTGSVGRGWEGVRDHRHPFFESAIASTADREKGRALWRIATPPAVPPLELLDSTLIEWGGCLRWVATSAPDQTIHDLARRAGGHAVRWYGAGAEQDRMPAMDAVTLRLHQQLKAAFDPHGIFNPGRLHPNI